MLDRLALSTTGKPWEEAAQDIQERFQALLADNSSVEESGLLYDNELQIYPWGFRNIERERKYRQYFHLTFASNNKRLLMWAYCCSAIANGYSATRYLFTKHFELSTVGTELALTFISVVMAYFFSRRVVPSFFKTMFGYFLEFLFCVAHWLLIVHHCSPNANHSKTLVDMAIISFSGHMCCPRWIHIVFNVLSYCWIPIIWNIISGQLEVKLMTETGSISFLGQWCVDALLISTTSTLFGAVVCVHRRRAWLRQKHGRRGIPQDQTDSSHSARASRSPSPSRSPLGTLRHRGGKRRSASPLRDGWTSRSPSPLPRLAEGSALASDTWQDQQDAALAERGLKASLGPGGGRAGRGGALDVVRERTRSEGSEGSSSSSGSASDRPAPSLRVGSASSVTGPPVRPGPPAGGVVGGASEALVGSG